MAIFLLICDPLAHIKKYDGAAAVKHDELTTLGLKYGTDKVKHRYTMVYHSAFGSLRHNVQKFLEVGVFYGASLKMWHDYFPAAQVHGIDIFKILPGPSTLKYNAGYFWKKFKSGALDARYHLHKANQSDAHELAQLAATLGGEHAAFDIIVEDGSHMQRDQQMNLGLLFPLVRPGGFYVIEDIHSGLEKGYDERPGSSATTLSMIAEGNKTGRYLSKFLSPPSSQYLASWIDSATVHATWRVNHDQTCIIRKRLHSRDVAVAR